jgi:hypothetical protein
VESEGDLLEVIRTLHAAGSLAGGLHRRQEEGHQDADDGDDDEQLDERKAFRPPT